MADVKGRDVWLMHPWALGEVPRDWPKDGLCIGWWPAEHHAAWPWSDRRWRFVAERLVNVSTVQWHATQAQLAEALARARSVQTQQDVHVARWLPGCVGARPAPRLFADVERPCASFSSWWKHATRGVKQLTDLPGLQALPVHTLRL